MSTVTITEAQVAECCGSRHWRELMAAAVPFGSGHELQSASERAFDALTREDWMQAFSVHSMIGAVRQGDSTGAREQSAMDSADAELRIALAAGNVEYQSRFGFVFLIRASGRSAEEILAELRRRLQNCPEVEFANACAQQREITALRLAGLSAP